MVVIWDDNDEETSDDEEAQEMSNLALMVIRKESIEELDEVSDPTYDELYDAFKELHDDWLKIGKKNACLKKKDGELSNENEYLSAKIACLALKIKLCKIELHYQMRNQALHMSI